MSLVGSVSHNIVGSGTGVTVTLAQTTTQHNLLIAILLSDSGVDTFSMPAGWTQSDIAASGADKTLAVWYYVDNPGGITSVACTRGGSTFPFGAIIAEYSSMVTTSPVDQHTTKTGNGTALTGTAYTTTNANDLLIVAGADDGSTLSSPTSGWTMQNTQATGGVVMGYADRTVSSTGTYNAGMTSGSSGAWVDIQVAFKAAAGGGVAIAGESDGVGTASTLALPISHSLAGEADGVATPKLNLSVLIAGEADGVGTATALTLTVSHAITGQASGVGTGTALTPTVSHLITAEADGVGTATTLALTVSHNLAGEADGRGTATTLTPTVSHLIIGEADGTGVGTTLAFAGSGVSIAGTANGSGAASALALPITHSFAGEADGVGTATLSLPITHQLSGEADGSGVGSSLNLTVSHPLSGAASGLGTASLALPISKAIAGQASGLGAASFTLTVTRGIQGESDGVAVATLALTVSHLITGTVQGAGGAELTVTILILTVRGFVSSSVSTPHGANSSVSAVGQASAFVGLAPTEVDGSSS